MKRLCLSIAIVLALLASGRASAPEKNPLDAKTMKVALHAGTPEEQKFIDRVLQRVDNGSLPLELVETTFLWARKKPRYQFQYFKHGLKLRAESEGIRL